MRIPNFVRSSLVATLLAGPLCLGAQLDRSQWRLVDFSSENLITGETAQNAIDGNPETQWHTRWHGAREVGVAQPPHHITLDLGHPYRITAVRYRSRAHGEGGLPDEYSLELGPDGSEWQTAASGRFAYRSEWSPHAVIQLQKPVEARYLRLTIRSLRESKRAVEPGLVVGELDVAAVGFPLEPTTKLAVPQSREWNFGGYHWWERHRNLLYVARRARPELVFLGDSITHQWGGLTNEPTPRPGQALWQKYYSNRKALCLGYGWDRVENMLWRIRHGEIDDADLRLAVVLAGTNNLEVNTPEEIAEGVGELCAEIHRRKPHAHILLLAIFPRGEDRSDPPVEETNRLLAKLKKRSYITFKDIGQVFFNDKGQLTRDIMPDLLHLSPEGYRRWAMAIEPEVVRYLKEKPLK